MIEIDDAEISAGSKGQSKSWQWQALEMDAQRNWQLMKKFSPDHFSLWENEAKCWEIYIPHPYIGTRMPESIRIDFHLRPGFPSQQNITVSAYHIQQGIWLDQSKSLTFQRNSYLDGIILSPAKDYLCPNTHRIWIQWGLQRAEANFANHVSMQPKAVIVR